MTLRAPPGSALASDAQLQRDPEAVLAILKELKLHAP